MSAERRVMLWDPSADPYEGAMKFRLTWHGQLFGASRNSSRASEKHEMRMVFHEQLKRLWRQHEPLRQLSSLPFPDYETAVSGQQGGPFREKCQSYQKLVSENHNQHGHKWLPLVLEASAVTCSVDILLLRSGAKGHVLHLGDIDGRLKVIFDALGIPRDGSGVTPPDRESEPTYVLLEDDRLISHVAVESDELLEPTGETEVQNDARVIITINVKMTSPNWLSLRFHGA